MRIVRWMMGGEIGFGEGALRGDQSEVIFLFGIRNVCMQSA